MVQTRRQSAAASRSDSSSETTTSSATAATTAAVTAATTAAATAATTAATPSATVAAATGSTATAAGTGDTGPIFFWKAREKHGEFCQWHRCSFAVTTAEIAALARQPPSAARTTAASTGGKADGNEGESSDNDNEASIQFTSTEQFMMYCKALRFDDPATAARILACTNPRQQKALGRQVAGYTESGWDAVKRQVVEAGSVAKFGQTGRLRRVLLGTGDRLLVETSPMDRIWGIGITADKAIGREGEWGQNLLGKALMAARERLREGGGRGGPGPKQERETKREAEDEEEAMVTTGKRKKKK